MILLSVLTAPTLMATATVVERRLGTSAAGWVAALPVSLGVAVVAVAVDAGPSPARALALSAAAHVPAQVAFAVAAAYVLVRRGHVVGLVTGAAAYVTVSLAIAALPEPVAAALAVPALAVAPRVMPCRPPTAGATRGWLPLAVTCAASMVIVAAAVLSSRVAGPILAGAITAFPTMSTALALVIASRHGNAAAAPALLGLVRSLPCYVTFCLVFTLAQPPLGIVAIAAALAGALLAARITWGGVALAR